MAPITILCTTFDSNSALGSKTAIGQGPAHLGEHAPHRLQRGRDLLGFLPHGQLL